MNTARRKGAIVGYGFIAEHGHVPAYEGSTDFEIVAVVDPCAARGAAAARALPGAIIFEDMDSLLAKMGKDLDFVDITAPPYVHASIAKAALESGLHVLCEKPLTTTAADARELIELAEKNKRVLFPAHCYKHAPVIRKVAEVLESGVIGAVHHVTLDTFRATHARGVPEWNTDWRRQRKYSGGGIAMDHGSHTFYLAFDWLKSFPTAITAKMTASDGADTEDAFSASITFPTGTASAHLTWRAGIRKVLYTIHGTTGAIRVEDDDVEVSTMDRPLGPDGKTTWTMRRERVSSNWMDASHTGWFRSMYDRFADAIARHDYAGADARTALACIELIEEAYASSDDGCRERRLRSGR